MYCLLFIIRNKQYLEHLKEGDLLEELALYERIILKLGIVNVRGRM